MIDDDIDCISRLYVEKGENSKLDCDEAYDIVQYIGNCAKLAGAYLFGISKEVNPLSYNDHKPIELTGVLNGDIGMLEGSKLFFHPKVCEFPAILLLSQDLLLWLNFSFRPICPTFMKHSAFISI